MIGERSLSAVGYLACNARKEACASDSLFCDDNCTTYAAVPPLLGAEARRGAGGVTGRCADGAEVVAVVSGACCGSSCSGAPRAAFAAGAAREGAALCGRALASDPSGRIVTVRTRLGSLDPPGVAAAGEPADGAGPGGGGNGDDVPIDAVLAGPLGANMTGGAAVVGGGL